MKKNILRLFLVTLALSLLACATELVRSPATLLAGGPQAQMMQISKLAVLDFGPSHAKQLLPGSRWSLVGNVPQGSVFKPVDGVLTIHGANAYEAYLVISAAKVVGFYLPGERAWTALQNPVAIEMNAAQ
jgi:hypothetical protein